VPKILLVLVVVTFALLPLIAGCFVEEKEVDLVPLIAGPVCSPPPYQFILDSVSIEPNYLELKADLIIEDANGGDDWALRIELRKGTKIYFRNN
jgi:hypothetical protein